MEKEYDVVVIGAGSGGLTAAVGATKIGKSVLLVEKEHMGGECTNSGCVPSKALLNVAKDYHKATKIAGKTTESDTYRDAAFTYVRNTIDSFLEHETPETFEQLGIDVVLGEAVFNTKCSVKVGETMYQYKKAIIATGSSPRQLKVEGLGEEHILTNQNIFELESIPNRTLVIGAGPIGLEMGQALSMLGSEVTIATIDKEFGRLEDEAIRPKLREAFDNLGVKILTQAFISKVEGQTASFDIKDDNQILDRVKVGFDKVLVAIGRVPNIPAGLEEAGIKHDDHCIMVDNQFRTSNKYVYAVGDVSQRLKFTHTADDTSRQVIARIASKGWLRINKRKSVPKVTYTAPEVAQVGMSWKEAQDKYDESQLMRIEVPFDENDRARTNAEYRLGHLVVIARRLNGAILGAHIIGPNAGELINTFTLAIDEKVSMWKLQKLIFAYPTYSLVIKKAGDKFVGQQLADLKPDLLSLLKRNSPKFIAAVLWVGLIMGISSYQSAHEMTTTETALKIFDFVSMTAWGPIVYIIFYAIRPITFFPATALTILSGIFFGFLWGTILTVIAATLSASVAYTVGRFFGAGLKLEDSVLGNWITALRKNTFEAVLTTRLIFLPFDLISYAAGVLQTRFAPFVTATFFGILLGTATFVSIGASLDLEEFKMEGFSFSVLDPKFLGLSAGIFIISLFLSRFLKRWKADM